MCNNLLNTPLVNTPLVKWYLHFFVLFFSFEIDRPPENEKNFEVELEDIPCLGVIFAKSCIRNKALRVGGWNS